MRLKYAPNVGDTINLYDAFVCPKVLRQKLLQTGVIEQVRKCECRLPISFEPIPLPNNRKAVERLTGYHKSYFPPFNSFGMRGSM
jgi:hypothetical protein